MGATRGSSLRPAKSGMAHGKIDTIAPFWYSSDSITKSPQVVLSVIRQITNSVLRPCRSPSRLKPVASYYFWPQNCWELNRAFHDTRAYEGETPSRSGSQRQHAPWQVEEDCVCWGVGASASCKVCRVVAPRKPMSKSVRVFELDFTSSASIGETLPEDGDGLCPKRGQTGSRSAFPWIAG
jgi:hypothetical protein